ncbi:MAG: 4-hydroxy-tetrahydrodipicolinate reductase [Lachnospiraceae bacterium]|nr:4-hydroxy-tetrahydrodipicolinate reductase [Lachnospiraceae bacterium]
MTRIIMRGCNGKMGQVITNLVKDDADAVIVAGIDLNTSIENDYPVFTSLDECDVDADVVIDFTSTKLLTEMLDWSVKKQVPVVLCTTGYSPEQLAEIDEASKKVALLRSANMSLGINLIMKLVQAATNVLAQAGYDIEIVERHHNQKLDAPSGTALAIADAINEVLNNEYAYKYDRSTERAKREKKEIGLSAVRGGTIVGEHEIIFAGTDEVIEIKHTAYSKAIFGKGAVEAAKFLKGQAPGLYNMSQAIKEI